MESVKRTYKPKKDKLEKLKKYYSKLKKNETKKNNGTQSDLFRGEGR
jgi:hypothetical protein